MIEAVGTPETTGAPEAVGMPEVVGMAMVIGATGMPETAETTGMAGMPEAVGASEATRHDRHDRSGDDTDGLLPWPEALGDWPAVVLLLLFAWFELVFPAPRDPAILAFAAAGYSVFTVAGMVLFG